MTAAIYGQGNSDFPQVAERWETLGMDKLLVVRPGLALNMYSTESAEKLLPATADVLRSFLNFTHDLPLYIFNPGIPGGLEVFDAIKQAGLFHRLRSRESIDEEDGFGIAIYSTRDGQAQEYGFQLDAINTTTIRDNQPESERSKETSLLRIELP